MKKLKQHFLIFFLSLALIITILLTYAYNQMAKDEIRLWQGIAENIFNQMQANISEFLLKEDQRSFSEYRYFYIPESQINQNAALNISPLAKIPQNDTRGLIGYFQIDPDGHFYTPYLPPEDQQSELNDLKQRQELQNNLSVLTQTLQDDVVQNYSQTHAAETAKSDMSGQVVELGKLLQPTYIQQKNRKDVSYNVQNSPNSRTTIYPNPLKSKSENNKKNRFESFGGYGSQPSSIPSLDKDEEHLKEKVSSNIAQYKTFKEQKIVQQGVLPSEGESNSVETQSKLPSIFTDPFRARLIEWKNIVFYRKVWVDQKMYIQGFVLSLKEFYHWLMDLTYVNSQLPSFTLSTLSLENNDLANVGELSLLTISSKTLFKRNLGYPINQFLWSVQYLELPSTASRTFLHILTTLLFLIVTVGLYFIYRSAASEIHLSQKRQDFVSAVTHELKTPLTSIRMYSEMLNEDWVKDEQKKKEYYQLMTKEGDRLSRLIDNVLHLARLEKHNYQFNLVTTSPNNDFETLSHELGDLIQQEGFEWITKVQDGLPPITYDPEALKQILIILIDNSIKFSKDSKEKKIEMTLEQKDQNLIWSISDYGPGVPNKEMDKIFEKFYRIENEYTRKTKGTGIGLAMAAMLCQGMGVKIMAQNRDPVGLTITLNFQIHAKI